MLNLIANNIYSKLFLLIVTTQNLRNSFDNKK